QAIAARTAFVELIEQDQILEDMGASFEDRVRAFEGVPKSLWPPKFREELNAYPEVTEIFADEEIKEQKEKAGRDEMKKEWKKTTGDMSELAEPVISLFFDAMGSVADIYGAEVTKGLPATQGGLPWAQNRATDGPGGLAEG